MQSHASYNYSLLADRIRTRIVTGKLRPGEKLETLRKISKDTGYSQVTVLRAIKDLEQRGYLSSVQRKGVFVRQKLPSETRPTRISLVAKNVRLHAGWLDMTNGQRTIQDMLMRSGRQITIQGCMVHPHDGRRWEFVPAEEIIDEKTNVILLLGIYDFDYMHSFTKHGVPVVAYDVNAVALGIDSSFFENVSSAARLTQHLIERGHHTIAFLGGPLKPVDWNYRVAFDPSAQEREIGYCSAIRANGKGRDCHVYHCSSGRFDADFDDMVSGVFKELPECTAAVSECHVDIKRFTDRNVELAFWRKPLSEGEQWPANAVAIAECDDVELAKATVELVELRLVERNGMIQHRIVHPKLRFRDWEEKP